MEYTSCCNCARAEALVRMPNTILLKKVKERVVLNAKMSDDPSRWQCLKFRYRCIMCFQYTVCSGAPTAPSCLPTLARTMYKSGTCGYIEADTAILTRGPRV